MSSICRPLPTTFPTPLRTPRREGSPPLARRRSLHSFRARMPSASLGERESIYAPSGLPPLPEQRIVLGVGAVSVDFLATVAAYPNPDDKIRSTSLKVQGGGNAGNALTCASRLGLKPRLISKVANDSQGRNLLSELEADGIDTSYMVVAEEGNSPFTYVIVDSQTKSRTCIHSPGPEMAPQDLSPYSLSSALDGTRLVYFDARLHETALVVAKEATKRGIPILVDAERKREGLDDLLNMASYVVCAEKFPMAWTDTSSISSALVALLLRLPHVKFVIVTLGEKGCLALERSQEDALDTKETNIDCFLEFLQQRVDHTQIIPTCVFSESNSRLRADGIGTVTGRLYLGTAEQIPVAELVDTTGAGDAFIGSILYGICAGMPVEKMLPFASQVAAAGCRALGARTGLPMRSDPRLLPFF